MWIQCNLFKPGRRGSMPMHSWLLWRPLPGMPARVHHQCRLSFGEGMPAAEVCGSLSRTVWRECRLSGYQSRAHVHVPGWLYWGSFHLLPPETYRSVCSIGEMGIQEIDCFQWKKKTFYIHLIFSPTNSRIPSCLIFWLTVLILG